jgi:hypothetical protein
MALCASDGQTTSRWLCSLVLVLNEGPNQDGIKVPTIEECKTYASEYKALGADPANSARRASVLTSISRSWATLAHQLENLSVIVKDEKTK